MAKNKFDTYLTKTSIRSIKFSENKQRWNRLIKNDLYSKTLGHGVPTLQRIEIKERRFVRSPPFFADTSSRKNLSELKNQTIDQPLETAYRLPDNQKSIQPFDLAKM